MTPSRSSAPHPSQPSRTRSCLAPDPKESSPSVGASARPRSVARAIVSCPVSRKPAAAMLGPSPLTAPPPFGNGSRVEMFNGTPGAPARCGGFRRIGDRTRTAPLPAQAAASRPSARSMNGLVDCRSGEGRSYGRDGSPQRSRCALGTCTRKKVSVRLLRSKVAHFLFPPLKRACLYHALSKRAIQNVTTFK
jgi:hypothetical protein